MRPVEGASIAEALEALAAVIAELRAARAVSQEASELTAEVDRMRGAIKLLLEYKALGRALPLVWLQQQFGYCSEDKAPPADEVAGLTEAERDVLSAARTYAANPTDMNGILLLKFAEELRENHLKGKR